MTEIWTITRMVVSCRETNFGRFWAIKWSNINIFFAIIAKRGSRKDFQDLYFSLFCAEIFGMCWKPYFDLILLFFKFEVDRVQNFGDFPESFFRDPRFAIIAN